LFKGGQSSRRPLVVWIDLEVITLRHDKARRGEQLSSAFNLDRGLKTLAILRTGGEIPADDVFVDFLLVPGEIRCMSGWVDGRMGFIVVLALPRGIVAAVL
jgi:hypothetical protein